MKVKRKKSAKLRLKRNNGQTLPTVIILGAIMSVMALSLAFLFQQNMKLFVKTDCIIKKQELASIALEHVIYKLQQGSGWGVFPKELTGYSHEFHTNLGTYAVHVTKGNLFPNPTTGNRQGTVDYRTIGIKIKTGTTGCVGDYYSVVKRVAYGGTLISKGFTNLPCTSAGVDDDTIRFFWGDVFSSATDDQDPVKHPNPFCIPAIPVGTGNISPQPWNPEVYAASRIYTSVYAAGGRSGNTYYFGTTYDDMSPSAHCHPYSEFAVAPEIDLDYFRMLARRQGHYFGPSLVSGVANPYYVDAAHDVTYTAANTEIKPGNLANILACANSVDDVLFIDTIDGLPLTYTASAKTWNTYTGHLATTLTSANVPAGVPTPITTAVNIYQDATHQFWTRGMIFCLGPLILKGNDPDQGMATASNVTGIALPDNYYYPQATDGFHFTWTGTAATSYLNKIKHHGLLYMGGDLTIGGKRSNATATNLAIYGTVYMDRYAELNVNTTDDASTVFYVYYDESLNLFGVTTSKISTVSFQELTYLVPTPAPIYPSSFSN